jgi:hypothetical protein
MKDKWIFLFVLLFMLVLAQSVRADEITDLKDQIKTLQEAIDGLKTQVQMLEEKQQAQVQEVKKIPELKEAMDKLQKEPAKKTKAGIFEGTHVGGHLKLYMFDQSVGERNDVRQHNNISAGVSALFLYFAKELTDWLSVEVQTETDVTASATPSLGSDISRATSTTTSISLYQAFMTCRLPKGAELKIGQFYPMFSDEYARDTWWHELYHQNKGLDSLESWRDTGLELYKSFDFEKWSLPAYLSLFNGNSTYKGEAVDNNEGKTFLLHLAPEFFQTKLRLLGTFAIGKWDVKNEHNLSRYALGFEWKYKKFDLVSEYLYSKWDDLTLTPATNTSNGTKEGYYIKVLYELALKWKGLLKYSRADLYNTGTSFMRSDIWKVMTYGLIFSISDTSTIIGQVSCVSGKRSDDSEEIKYIRPTLSWRTTF